MNTKRNIPGLLYQALSSLNASIYILAALIPFYVLGTIFPQGGDPAKYAEAGGKFQWAAGFFGLLDIFNSAWFLVPAFVVFLNLAVCAYDRFFKIWTARHPSSEPSPDFSIDVPLNRLDAEETAAEALEKELGFKPRGKAGGFRVWERGLYYRWLTWLYHAGIAACFIGFIVSGLFVIEGIVTLKPGVETGIKSIEPEKLGYLVNKDSHDADFKIVLDEFITEYIEAPRLDYPKGKFDRMALALGSGPLSYKKDAEPIFTKDWFSKLRIVKGGITVAEKTIEVNSPLKFSGYTFYQMAYDGRIKFKADGETKEITIAPGESLGGGDVTVARLRAGKLFRMDGTVDEVTPYVVIRRTNKPQDPSAPPEKLEKGGRIKAGGKTYTFTGFEEDSILSYRYDPGVPILWIAGIFVLAAMSLRCFGSWTRLYILVEERRGGSTISIKTVSRGIWADDKKLRMRIESAFGRAETRHLPHVR